MTNNDPIISALDEQVDCYRRLAKLAEIQHEHVQHSRTEELLNVLLRRQEVLDQLSRLEQAIAPAKTRWGEFLGELDPARRAQAETMLAETRRLLEQITLSDRNDTMVLQQRKLNLGKQIQQTQAARQVNRHYATAAYGKAPTRMDIQR